MLKQRTTSLDDTDRSVTLIRESLGKLLKHVPDFVAKQVECDDCYEEESVGFLLFIDINGFTSLSEEYGMRYQKGVDDLTSTLNGYMTLVVRQIMKFGGDVVKFAGDAVLCWWELFDFLDPVNENNEESFSELERTALSVLECANEIHKKCDFYKTKDGKTLSLKTALSYGTIYKIIIKTTNCNHFFLLGTAIERLKICGHKSEQSRIYMTEEFWAIVSGKLRHLQRVEFEVNTQTTIIGVNLRLFCHDDQCAETKKAAIYKVQKCSIISTQSLRTMMNSIHERTPLQVSQLKVQVEGLRRFILPRIFEKIWLGDSTRFMSELRHITCAFINFDFDNDRCNLHSTTSTMKRLLFIIEPYCIKYQGVLLKSIEFDKGWSFLCVFGLPGIPVRNKAASALLFAAELMQKLAGDDGNENETFENSVEQDDDADDENHEMAICNIGVATGLTFCGVVGHPDRHEYTCIGDKVNLSARLSMNYPNLISCDDETYWVSNLDASLFYELPTRPMKGIKATDQIVRSLVWQRNAKWKERNEEFTFVGHRLELTVTAAHILSFIEQRRGEEKCNFLFFQSLPGYGNTAFIRYVHCLLQRSENIHLKALSVHLKAMDVDKDSAGLKKIFEGICNLVGSLAYEAASSTIDKQPSGNIDDDGDDSQCRSVGDDAVSMIDRFFLEPEHFIAFLKALYKQSKILIVLLIDEVQYLDLTSFRVLQRLQSECSLSVLVVGTIKSLNALDIERGKVMKELIKDGCVLSRIRVLTMVDIVRVICAQFDVNCVESSLVYSLYGSVGMTAALCSATLQELMRKGTLTIADKKENLKCISVSKVATKSKNLLQDIFATRVGSVCERYSTVNDKCLFTQTKLTRELIPASIETLMLSQYDGLEIGEQAVLAQACILKNQFSRTLLYGVCEEVMSKHEFNQVIQRLMSNSSLKCARDHRERTSGHRLASIRRRRIQIKDRHVVVCECVENHTNLPFFCQMLSFTHNSLKYSLFNSQTKEARVVREKGVIRWMEKRMIPYMSLLNSCQYCAGSAYNLVFETAINPRAAVDLPEELLRNKTKISMKLEDIVQEIHLTKIESESLVYHQHDDYYKSPTNFPFSSKGSIQSWKRMGQEAPAIAMLRGDHYTVKFIIEEMKKTSNNVKNYNPLLPLYIYGRSVAKTVEKEAFPAAFSTSKSSKDVHEDLVSAIMADMYALDANTENNRPPDFRSCRCDELVLSTYLELYHHSRECNDYERVAYYAHCLFDLVVCMDSNNEQLEELIENVDLQTPLSINYAPESTKRKIWDMVSLMERAKLEYMHDNCSSAYKSADRLRSLLNDYDGKRIAIMHQIWLTCHTLLVATYCEFSNENTDAASNSIIPSFFENEVRELQDLGMRMSHNKVQVLPVYMFALLADQRSSYVVEHCKRLLDTLRERLNWIHVQQKSIALNIAKCCSLVCYHLVKEGGVEEGVVFGLEAIEIYHKMNANIEIITLVPYLIILGCLMSKHIDQYVRIVEIYEHLCDEIVDQKTVYNWLCIFKLELAEETGFLLDVLAVDTQNNNRHSSLALSRVRGEGEHDYGLIFDKLRALLLRHTEHLGFHNVLSKMYGHCLVAQSLARSGQDRLARIEFARAVRFIYSRRNDVKNLSKKQHRLRFEDPLAKRALLKLAECQLLLEGCAFAEKCWLLDVLCELESSAFESSIFEPLVTFYRAILRKTNGNGEHKELMRRALKIASEKQQLLILEWIEHNLETGGEAVHERKLQEWNGGGVDQPKIIHFSLMSNMHQRKLNFINEAVNF